MKSTIMSWVIALFCLAILILVGLCGCATVSNDIPPCDIVMNIGGTAWVFEQGCLNPEYEGKNWMKETDFDEKVEKMLKERKKKEI